MGFVYFLLGILFIPLFFILDTFILSKPKGKWYRRLWLWFFTIDK